MNYSRVKQKDHQQQERGENVSLIRILENWGNSESFETSKTKQRIKTLRIAGVWRNHYR